MVLHRYVRQGRNGASQFHSFQSSYDQTSTSTCVTPSLLKETRPTLVCVVLKCKKYQDFNFIEIFSTRGQNKYVIKENLHQKLKTVLQINDNHVPDSRVSSLRSGLKNKILEIYKLALGNRALTVPNAFKIREKYDVND